MNTSSRAGLRAPVICAVERRGLLQGWLGAKRSRQATLSGLGCTAGLALALLVAGGAPPVGAAGQAGGEQRECLAMTVYWEAGGEERAGMEAVAAVVLNRRDHPDFPASVCEVVREGGTAPGCQFTFWCDGKSETPRDADVWRESLAVAAEALEGRIADPTGGALFFHAASLETAPWRVPRERTTRIGGHVYYR